MQSAVRKCTLLENIRRSGSLKRRNIFGIHSTAHDHTL